MLTQSFVAKGTGRKKTGELGGAVIWTRRPMNREELLHVSRAVSTAAHVIGARLDGDVPGVASPEIVLASIDDNDEAATVGLEWLREAEEEVARRQVIVAGDYERLHTSW